MGEGQRFLNIAPLNISDPRPPNTFLPELQRTDPGKAPEGSGSPWDGEEIKERKGVSRRQGVR